MKLYNSILDLIGKTPIVKFNKLSNPTWWRGLYQELGIHLTLGEV